MCVLIIIDLFYVPLNFYLNVSFLLLLLLLDVDDLIIDFFYLQFYLCSNDFLSLFALI